MNLQQIHFEPVAMARFTADEVTVLKRCASTHYDGHCKAAGEPGGTIYGIGNAVEHADGVRSLKWSEIDTLCKVLEFPPPGVETIAAALFLSLRGLLDTMQKARPPCKEYTHNEL